MADDLSRKGAHLLKKTVSSAKMLVKHTEDPQYPMVADPIQPRMPRSSVFGVPLEQTLIDNRKLPQVFSDCILFILQRQGTSSMY